MEEQCTRKAEHVSGIVLQPLWRIQNIDWTVRKNVFETDTSHGLVDENNFKSSYPLLKKVDTRKEAFHVSKRQHTDAPKDRVVNSFKYRPPCSVRKRWIGDGPRK